MSPSVDIAAPGLAPSAHDSGRHRDTGAGRWGRTRITPDYFDTASDRRGAIRSTIHGIDSGEGLRSPMNSS